MKIVLENIPGYEVYINGMIFSIKRNKFLKIGLNNKGYQIVDICINGIKKKKLIHRLIAEAFIPNPFNKSVINHINGIKTDNRIENLEWVSSSENQIHAYRNNLKKVTLKQRKACSINLKNFHKNNKIKK